MQQIVGWGSFSPALPGGSTVDDLLPNPANTLTPERPYNSINLLVTTSVAGANSGSVVISGLALSSPTLTLSAGSAFAGMAGSGASSSTQRVLIDGDFSQEDWTLTGLVTITKSGNGCPDCAIFAITGTSVAAEFPIVETPVQEPATFGYAVGGLLLLLIGSLRRRP